MNESINTKPILDYRFFKFRKINKHLIGCLVNSRLYFAKPDSLNDPFDCKLDLRSAFTRAAHTATGRRKDWFQGALNHGGLLDSWKGHFENVGVCAFSLDMNDKMNEALLWSHYADEHKGLCLLYQFPQSFVNDPQNRILGVDRVKYEDDALTEWLKDAPMELNSFFKGNNSSDGLIRTYLRVKSRAWKYENEARIIRQEHGFLDIPRDFLKQVCFGLRTPEADIDLIKKLAREHCGCTSFGRMIRDDGSDFRIRAAEI